MNVEFFFDARTGDTIGVVVLSGRLDLQTAEELKTRIKAVVATGRKQLVVDLSAVPFVDSTGLGALIGGLKTTRMAGGDFRIAGATEQIRYLLQVSTLDRVLVPYATVEDALIGYA